MTLEERKNALLEELRLHWMQRDEIILRHLAEVYGEGLNDKEAHGDVP